MEKEDGDRMEGRIGFRAGVSDDPPPAEPDATMRVMDPGYGFPGYWKRFHANVMERAALELARRRGIARESVAAVLSGWSRSLIPVAAAAAVVAAFLIGSEVRHASDAGPPLALEDVLAGEVEDGVLPPANGGQIPANPVAFMALVEGNVP